MASLEFTLIVDTESGQCQLGVESGEDSGAAAPDAGTQPGASPDSGAEPAEPSGDDDGDLQPVGTLQDAFKVITAAVAHGGEGMSGAQDSDEMSDKDVWDQGAQQRAGAAQ